MNTSTPPRTTLREFIDGNPIGIRQRVIVGLMFLVMIADGMEITLISHIFPSLIKAWGIPMSAITLTVAITIVAMAVGMLLSGPAAERWGRKGVTLAAFVLFCVATACLGLSQDIQTFVALRVVACLGLGAVMPLAMTIVDDWMPAARRAQMVTLSFSGVAFGSIVGAYLSAAIIPAAGWQTLALVAGLIPLIAVPFIVALVPEAPGVLVALGKSPERVRKTLSLIAGGRDVSDVDLASPVSTATARAPFATVFSRPLLSTTLLLWLIFCIVQGVNLLVLQYMPILLQRPDPGLNTTQSGLIVAMWGWGGLTGQVLMSFALKKFDRFRAMALALGWALAGMSIVASFSLSFVQLLVLMFAIGLALPAATAATFSLALLAYPMQARATGLGAAGFAGRLGALGSGLLGGSLIAGGWGLSSIFLMLCTPVAAGVLTVLALRRVTGRTR